jgi:hypothetical protein
MAMLQLGEICPGLVVYASPYELEDWGISIRGFWDPHPFLCLDVCGAGSKWVMLSTKYAPEKIQIQPADKYEHPGWVGRPTYVCADTFSEMYTCQMLAASKIELSAEGHRNGITYECLRRVRVSLGLSAVA